jgi:hypothetical protein
LTVIGLQRLANPVLTRDSLIIHLFKPFRPTLMSGSFGSMKSWMDQLLAVKSSIGTEMLQPLRANQWLPEVRLIKGSRFSQVPSTPKTRHLGQKKRLR